MTDLGVQYGACRERISALVADLTPIEAATPVPACPAWTVHDVVAHLAGSVTDILSGNMDGVGTEEWTAAQVHARRDTPIAEMLTEWTAGAHQFEDGLRTFGGPSAALGVADAWHHEQDIRGALGHPGGKDPVAEHTAIVAYAQRIGAGLVAERRAPLRLAGGDVIVQSAPGDPGASVVGAPFELARAVGGRRTEAQIRAFTWDGDAEPYIATLAGICPLEALPL